jgi:Tol biopolymer transport system component
MTQTPDSLLIGDLPKEHHLKNVRQLTFGGQNAEAYWSTDGKKIVYQTRQPEYPDEQIVVMNPDGSNKTLVSTGLGRCTCAYFSPDGKWVYFSSTHMMNKGAQAPVDMSKGYVWKVNPDFAMFRTPASGPKAGKSWEPVFTRFNSYVAETTIDPNGKYLTFTSDFEGDLEIYRADLDGSNVKRLTNHPGYDGGPFVSWDGKKIAYRRDVIATKAELDDYTSLLKQHMVRPSKLELWVMDADGSHNTQITDLNCASFAPFIHPDGKRIIFCSNFGDKKGREFDIWMIGMDGNDLERITYAPEFDGFPMFTRDGKRLVFASNRNGKVRGETNIFVADWVD